MTTNDRGFSLLHVLLGLVTLLTIALAVTLIVRPIFVLSTAVAPTSGLSTLPNYMRACVLNGTSWAATVADPDNKSLECLRNQTVCDTAKLQPPNTYLKLKASAAKDDLCYQNHNTMPGTGAGGFTKAGLACTGFSENGNEACPYRFNVYWRAECPDGAASCLNPVVRVNGDLVRGSHDPQAAADKDLARFALRTVRGRSDRTKYFVLNEVTPPGKPAMTAPCSLKGNLRVFNRGYDSGGYLKFLKNGYVEFAPGTYACRISVPGYRVGNFKAILLDMTQPPGRPVLIGTSEYSPIVGGYAQTRSEIVGTFKLRQTTPLAVIQFCSGAAAPEAEAMKSMGVAGSLIKDLPETYSVMECRVL